MADVFISYARDDAEFAERFRIEVEAGGFPTWMDTASMAGGERWTKEIESAIQAAACVVVVVSQSSNDSVWVRREVLYAQQLGKRVVPVLAAPIPLPLHLINLNALPLYDDFDAGLERLHETLRRQPMGSAVPASVKEETGEDKHPFSMGKVLGLFVGAAVVVVLVVIAVREEGLVAEVLATGIAIGGALLAMAWKADDAISLQFKRDLSLWLDGLDPKAIAGTVQRWPAHFAVLFDRVFGKKHLRWRCFFRSSIASLIAFLLCIFTYLQAGPPNLSLNSPFGLGWMIMFMASMGAFANLLPDYISLLETRWVIQRMKATPSISGQLVWLLFDLLATTVIYFLVMGVLFIGFTSVLHPSEFIPIVKEAFRIGLLSLHEPYAEEAYYFYPVPVWTTYFTTLWVLLYFLAQFLVRLAVPLRKTLGFLKYALPVEQRPLRAVGLVMALIACGGYWMVILPLSILGGRG